jgi:hypothetical protein
VSRTLYQNELGEPKRNLELGDLVALRRNRSLQLGHSSTASAPSFSNRSGKNHQGLYALTSPE